MNKYVGEWIVYDYTADIPSIENKYLLEIYYDEKSLETRLKFKDLNSIVDDHAIIKGFYNNFADEIIFNYQGKKKYSEANATFIFKSEKLFKGLIFFDSDFKVLKSFLVGIKKNQYCISDKDLSYQKKVSTLAGLWEVIGLNQEKVINSNFKIQFVFSGNCDNNYSFTGKYFKFEFKLGTEDEIKAINSQFKNKEFFLEGEYYPNDNTAAFIIKFGDYNVCGYSCELVQNENKFNAKFFNFAEDGTAFGIKD